MPVASSVATARATIFFVVVDELTEAFIHGLYVLAENHQKSKRRLSQRDAEQHG